MSVVDDVSSGFVKLASRMQAAIREAACRTRDNQRIGAFLATFDREDDNPFLNYAIPDDAATPSPTEVEALVAAYRERDRRPRLEYIPSLAPAVEPVLVSAGFAVEFGGRLPLMTCAAASEVREVVVDRVELVAPSSEDEYRSAASVQWEAYGEQGEAPQRVVDGLRGTVAAGGVVVLARDTETLEPAGAGLCTAPHGVFLMAHGEAEARIYARAGFLLRSEVLHISRS